MCTLCPHLLQSGSAAARLYLSSQIKEALRVSSLTSSAFDLPVIPLAKSFYASTNTFLTQVRTDSDRRTRHESQHEDRKWIHAKWRSSLDPRASFTSLNYPDDILLHSLNPTAAETQKY